MLLKYFKFISFLILIILVGCINTKSGFSLNELPEATVSQPYLQEIKMWGKATVDQDTINWKITPENTGLIIKKTISKSSNLYEGLEISGTPNFQGDINIWIYWHSSSPPYAYYDKTFILKVNAPTKQDIKD